MEVKIFPNGPFIVNTLLIWDEKTKEAMLVDPGSREAVEKAQDEVERKELKVKYIVNTHEHPDHIAANAWAKLTFPEAELLMHPEAARNLNFWVENEIGQLAGAEYSPQPDRTLEEGSTLELGSYTFKVFHTPGHSPGSIVLYSPEGEIVVVGDLIFRDSIGRYDLPMSNFQELKRSIFKVLKEVDHSATLIPGHGQTTNLERELRQNPFIRELIR